MPDSDVSLLIPMFSIVVAYGDIIKVDCIVCLTCEGDNTVAEGDSSAASMSKCYSSKNFSTYFGIFLIISYSIYC